MNIDHLNCPYCNQKLQTYTVPAFLSPCCERIITAREITDMHVSLSITNKRQLASLGMKGDVSRPVGYTRLESSRPKSNWTWVFWDMGFYYVRLIPKNIDIEDAGRPWGLALATTFTSEIEAHKFADSVDLFMSLIAAGPQASKDEEE